MRTEWRCGPRAHCVSGSRPRRGKVRFPEARRGAGREECVVRGRVAGSDGDRGVLSGMSDWRGATIAERLGPACVSVQGAYGRDTTSAVLTAYERAFANRFSSSSGVESGAGMEEAGESGRGREW